MSADLPTYHVVSHTHWDPEWYLSFQPYRIRLVRLMDRLLDILDRNPRYGPFMLDGQMGMVEQYLEVCPRREPDIRRHVQAGRLVIGPWHLMPELFMLTGECHIRNLLAGRKAAARFGPCMNVGYLCDTPGFISQLAQILKGFGIDSACGWRGIVGHADTGRTPFWLESPDGSRVLMILLPWAYGTIMDIGLEPARAAEVIAEVERSERPFWATGDLLLLDGADHREPVEGVVEAIAQVTRARPDIRIVPSTISNYAGDVLRRKPELATHRGELRATANSFIFASGILATRMNIKQASFRVHVELERWAEPFCALRSALGGSYPAGLLDRAWRFLLDNAFHDVIYGGHVDAATEDALSRYKQAFEIADWLGREAMAEIANAGPVPPASNPDTADEDVALVIFNACPRPYSGPVEADVCFDLAAEPRNETYLINEHTRRVHSHPYLLNKMRDFVIIDSGGRELPFQVNDRRMTLLNEDFSGRGVHRTGRRYVERVSVTIGAESIPPLGYARLSVRPVGESPAYQNARRAQQEELHLPAEGRKGEWRSPDLSGHIAIPTPTDLRLDATGRACENNRLRVEINPDGTLDVHDKKSAIWYRGLHFFEDSGDVGDHYFFHPPDSNRVITGRGLAAGVSVVRQGPVEVVFEIETEMELPAEASEDQRRRSQHAVSCRIVTQVTLASGSARLDFRTTVDNRARDHRLRVLFPTAIPGETCHAESVFDVVERPRQPAPRPHWREKPQGYFPQSRFVDISDGVRGLAFFNRGLPQYQVLPDGTYCLTLFRAVSHLGKYHLPEYGGRGWWAIDSCFPTPSAQMPGQSTYEYAMYFHEGGWERGQVYTEGERFCCPPRAIQAGDGPAPAGGGFAPDHASLVAIEPASCTLSAVKQAESGKGIIVRFCNLGRDRVRANLSFGVDLAWITRVNLAEDADLEEIRFSARAASLDVRPHEIVTLRVEFATRERESSPTGRSASLTPSSPQ